MWQIGQILGHPVGRQDGPDFIQIGPGSNQSGPEAIFLTELTAHLLTGAAKRLGVGIGSEQLGNPPAITVLDVRIGRQPLQDVPVGGDGPFRAAAVDLACPRHVVGFDRDHVVHDVQIDAVVNDDLRGRVAGIDIGPEGDIGRDRIKPGKRLGRRNG
jgi:hypothetical protein